ncbi:MAG: hypothetical protein GYA18_11355 [Chloroflexi bacterium]|nr:hypothetical protein [Chloroflexota bacterium]
MKDGTDKIKRNWFNLTNIIITLVLLFLLVIIIWNQSISEKVFLKDENELITESVPTKIPVELTPIPSEFYSRPADTSGIIIGSTILLVIVFGSAYWKSRTIK